MKTIVRRIVGGVSVLLLLATASGCNNNPLAPDSASLSPNAAALSKSGTGSQDTTTDRGGKKVQPTSIYGIGWP